MTKPIARILIAACFLLSAGANAQAPAAASVAGRLSALPVASVVGGSGAAAQTGPALPAALSTADAVLLVKSVKATARGKVYVLERVADRERVSLEVSAGRKVAAAPAVGTSVTLGVIGAGLVLSAAGQVFAFLPNALGEAMLHDERRAG